MRKWKFPHRNIPHCENVECERWKRTTLNLLLFALLALVISVGFFLYDHRQSDCDRCKICNGVGCVSANDYIRQSSHTNQIIRNLTIETPT